MKNFKEGYRALSRIKLMMAYDLKKTLNENKESIEEQFGYSYQQGLGMDKESQERRQKEYQKEYQKDKDESYPNYCSAKDKAVSLSGFKSPNGLEGLEALPKGFCAYRQPYPNCKRPEIKVERLQGTQFDIAVKDEPKSKEAYILLPKDAKIEFYNSFVDLSNAFDVFLSSLDSEDSKNLDSKLALKEFTNIIPVGAVRQFTIGSTTYLPFVCYDIAPSGKVDFMSFGGYKNNKNEVWENPFVKDDRSEYQRFVDEWGTVIQWTAVIVTAIAGIACDGCTFPIMLEILTELGIGFAVGYREWEKGNEVAAALSFITGMLPFLKLIPGFRGMNPQAMNKLMDSWKNSGLATTSTIDKYIDWYKSLDEDAQLVLNQMLRADEVGKNTFLGYTSKQLGEELSEIAFSKFDDVLKSDPNLLRKIPFTSRLWVRELGTNATVTLAAMIVDAVWGDKLNTSQSKDLTEEMRDKLDGIYDVVPERLKNEMTVNIMGNLLDSKNVIEDPEMKDIKEQAVLLQKKDMTNALSVFWQKSQQRVFSKNNATYVPIEEVPMVSGEDLELSPEEENEYRKKGWLPAIESNRDVQDGDSLQMINKMIWIKPKNK